MKPKSVVVAMKGYLGDTVMATPLLEGLREQGVDVKISAPRIVADALGERWSANYVPLGQRKGLNALRAQIASFRTLRPEAAILVNRSFRSALAAWLARVPIRVGHATEGRRALLTSSLPYDGLRNEASCYCDLAELAGFSLSQRSPQLFLTQAELQAGAAVLEGFERPDHVCALQPGARYKAKQMPIEVTLEVIAGLRQAGLEPILVGGPEESATAGEIQKSLSRPCADLVGQLPLRTTLGLLSNVRFSVGADTGLMHLSVAVGTPTVTIFGPNPASKWGHSKPPHQVIEAPGGEIAEVEASVVIAAALDAYRMGRVDSGDADLSGVDQSRSASVR